MTDDSGTSNAEATNRNEIDEARDEIARLRTQVSDADARAQTALAEGARLQAEIAAANDAVAAFETDAATLRTMLEDAEQRTQEAASRYRELAVRAEPSVPADLIAGDTIEAIDASIARARELAASVRSHIEAEAQAARVPAGAPQRSAPDLSAMTPEQKIRHGLAQRT
jgi:chromosome segregation ATPase